MAAERKWHSPDDADNGIVVTFDPETDCVTFTGWYDAGVNLGEWTISRGTLCDVLGWDTE